MIIYRLRLFFLLGLVLFISMQGTSLFAAELDISNLQKKPVVEQINIRGLKRTKVHIIQRELLFQIGHPLTTATLMESVQRIKNLQIFSFVRPFLKLLPDNKVAVTIELEEKWSTIPYFNYSAGGGTKYLKAGIYDINWLGKYIEIGSQYENFNGDHGGIIWFSNPRFLNKRATISTVLELTQKPRNLYNRDGEQEGSFVLQRKGFSFTYKKEMQDNIELGALFEFFDDKLHSVENLALDSHTTALIDTYGKSKTLLSTAIVRLGKLNYDIDIISGKQSQLLLSHSNHSLSSDYSFSKAKWINQAYWQLPWRSYIAAHFTLAASDTQLLQQYYYVGGFQHIRGYYDGQFRNRSYWQANLEYRIPSYRSQWLILQHIFFTDAVNASNHIKELTHFDKNYYSAGIGIRLLSPKIYSFNGRLDFAYYTSGKSKTSISLGSQHFF